MPVHFLYDCPYDQVSFLGSTMKLSLIFLIIVQLLSVSMSTHVHGVESSHNLFDSAHIHIGDGHDHHRLHHMELFSADVFNQLIFNLDSNHHVVNDHDESHDSSNHLHFSLVMLIQQHNLMTAPLSFSEISSDIPSVVNQIYTPPVPPPIV